MSQGKAIELLMQAERLLIESQKLEPTENTAIALTHLVNVILWLHKDVLWMNIERLAELQSDAGETET